MTLDAKADFGAKGDNKTDDTEVWEFVKRRSEDIGAILTQFLQGILHQGPMR